MDQHCFRHIVVMGVSGSGKTTLLNLLSGLDKPSSGTVNAPGRTERAFVFQDYNLLESLNARKNATLTAHFSGRRCSRDEVQKTFASLGLDGLERRLPAPLLHPPFERAARQHARIGRHHGHSSVLGPASRINPILVLRRQWRFG